METIDRKFEITAKNPCSGKIYTEKEGIFFCAHDEAVPAMLRSYRDECILLECGEGHIESITLLIIRVEKYQLKVKHKVPDTETDCELDRCIGGIDARIDDNLSGQ